MLKGSIKAVISNAKRREDIARGIVQSFFYVVVLKVQKLLVFYCPLGGLSMEKSCIGSYFSCAFTVLY
jgi:hypothetical protein